MPATIKKKKPRVTTSESTSRYLDAIYRLGKYNNPVRVTDIAAELDLKKGTVSGALKNLKALQLVSYSAYSSIRLTESGSRIAARIVHRNQLLAQFLTVVLQIDPEWSDKAARRMGPIMDKRVIEHMGQFLSKFCSETLLGDK